MTIALLGTRGVPARYGGFETAVEEIGARLASSGHRVVVYSRGGKSGAYRGMKVVSLPTVHTKYTDTLVHSFLSVAHALASRPEVVLVFNAANAPASACLRVGRIPFALHVDGLEWKRAKWGGAGRAYYLRAERLAVRTADELIVDSRGIGDYYAKEYGVEPRFIPYGAPLKERGPWSSGRVHELGLTEGGYHLVVARFEPENNVREIVSSYVGSKATLPLVVVGSAPYGDAYRRQIIEAIHEDPRVQLLGAVWDQELLDALYVESASYIHGHSVGGTNPSLLRAAGAGAYCIAFDVVFNREVLGDNAVYFTEHDELASSIEATESDRDDALATGDRLRADIGRRYDWDQVARDYERLCYALRDSRFAAAEAAVR